MNNVDGMDKLYAGYLLDLQIYELLPGSIRNYGVSVNPKCQSHLLQTPRVVLMV